MENAVDTLATLRKKGYNDSQIKYMMGSIERKLVLEKKRRLLLKKRKTERQARRKGRG